MATKKKAPQADSALGTTEQKESITTKDGRARNFACVVYPDSAEEHWLDIIAESKIPVFVSPLHDRDFNPTGEAKKAHYHVIVCYENKKNLEQVREFFDSFGGVGCEYIQSLRGYARYLCHLDNPEKAQYDQAQVKQFGGADYSSTIGLPTDKYKAIGEMIDWCDANDIVAYCELLEYARSFHYDWFRVLCDSGSLVMKEYLKSRKWVIDQDVLRYQADRIKELEEKLADPETGEICSLPPEE